MRSPSFQARAVEPARADAWEGLAALLHRAYEKRKENFTNVLYFYKPKIARGSPFQNVEEKLKFPAVSITGKKCYLNCKHCEGKLLEGMIPAETPKELFKVCLAVKEAGGEGCLISGGSLKDGRPPLTKFVGTIKRAKRELGLKIVVHAGLIDPSLAEALASAEVDGIMMDIVGSSETVKDVCRVEDYDISKLDEALSLLERSHVPTIPHIVAGLHFGRFKGEWEALRIAANHEIKALAIVVLTPLDGTPMEGASPPSPLDVAKLLSTARLLMPKIPLLLGCARPRGPYSAALESLSIKAGVNGVAYPSEEAYGLAAKLGLKPETREECCSLIWKETS